jgi:glycosyltransferase involved in cell wall biosynthesis
MSATATVAPVEQTPAAAEEPIRLVRVIARLNIGGPTIQAITLTRLLEPRGYATTLVHGREEPTEGNMKYLAEHLGVRPLHIDWLRRKPGPYDLRALPALMRTMRARQPQIVHTHAAKGGTLGRLAARLAARQAVLVHTFHGHSLSRYFSPRTARMYARIERFLARRTACLIAVSEEVRDDLVALGVAPRERFEVIRLGFDLSPFVPDASTRARERARVREELGIAEDERVVTLIARLVPIKRADRFLRVAQRLSAQPGVRFLVVGDGERRGELERSAEARALGEKLIWTGFRRDIPEICFASDVVVLTSDSEGTPVSLIEAQAAGVPVVGTAVGGVGSVVEDGVTGHLVEDVDEDRFADAVEGLLADPRRARRMGEAGRARVLQMFSLDQLVDELDALYRRLLAEANGGRRTNSRNVRPAAGLTRTLR